jgi:hypothetical protein
MSNVSQCSISTYFPGQPAHERPIVVAATSKTTEARRRNETTTSTTTPSTQTTTTTADAVKIADLFDVDFGVFC